MGLVFESCKNCAIVLVYFILLGKTLAIIKKLCKRLKMLSKRSVMSQTLLNEKSSVDGKQLVKSNLLFLGKKTRHTRRCRPANYHFVTDILDCNA